MPRAAPHSSASILSPQMPELSRPELSRRAVHILKMLKAAHQTADNDNQLSAAILTVMKDALAEGRTKARHGLETRKLKGAQCAESLAVLHDDLLRGLARFIETQILRLANPTEAEKVTLIAVGGYGRGRLAPASDIDILFLLPYKRNAACERFIEYMLYILWDMGLKVGHATRSINDCIAAAKADMTIRTALLESRLIYGSPALYEAFRDDFYSKIVRGTAREFVAAKLKERDVRHERAGRSRYLVEPNLKEGKGGLRDLNTLFWIARYSYQIESLDKLIALKLLTREELSLFRRCDRFLWEVRCHLHFLTGRAEERLSFDVQKPLAARFATHDSAGMKSVEKFMRQYFLVAKNVGDLTAIFCASLEENQKKARLKVRLPRLFQRQKQVAGFAITGGRLAQVRSDCFVRNPINLIRVFHLADKFRLDIHPHTLREITRHAKAIDANLRNDKEANQLFLEILTSRKNPERSLRRMNEAGVLGRFIPDFGKIVALMQFNMYHHYTADEHLLRAIGLLHEVENGAQPALIAAHPLAHELLRENKVNRRVLYLALLLHDIAKGRPEDHSIAGARIAKRLAPRLGLSKQETALTQWLVRQHLLMSDVAQRRDLTDPRTVEDFASAVQSQMRLDHLLVLTEIDIKAVGPGVFNSWKSQLLRELYYETQVLLSGHDLSVYRDERINAAQQNLLHQLGQYPTHEWTSGKLQRHLNRMSDAYWLSFTARAQLRHLRLIEQIEHGEGGDKAAPIIDFADDDLRGCSEVTLIGRDHAGLFARLTAACALVGLNILDAQITTTDDGLAVDGLKVQVRARSPAPLSGATAKRLKAAIEDFLRGEIVSPDQLPTRLLPKREEAFDVMASVDIDNNLSDSASVIEVSALDRPGLLYALADCLFAENVSVKAARIATFGERVKDVFYVTDLDGHKITQLRRKNKLKAALEKLIDDPKSPTEPPTEPSPKPQPQRTQSHAQSKMAEVL